MRGTYWRGGGIVRYYGLGGGLLFDGGVLIRGSRKYGAVPEYD